MWFFVGDKVSPAVRVDKLCDRNHITISYEKTTGDNRDTIQSYLIQVILFIDSYC